MENVISQGMPDKVDESIPKEKTPTTSENMGRPSPNKQLEIQTRCKWYYDHGMSEKKCLEETHYAKKTVSKYFKILRDKADELFDDDFIQQQKDSYRQLVAVIEEAMSDVVRQKLNMQDKKKQYEEFKAGQRNQSEGDATIPPSWGAVHYYIENRITELSLIVVQLAKLKTEILNTPTADIKIEQKIAEILKRNESNRQSPPR